MVPSEAVTAWCTGERPTVQPAPSNASRNALGTAHAVCNLFWLGGRVEQKSKQVACIADSP